jgi:hypothetical protein
MIRRHLSVGTEARGTNGTASFAFDCLSMLREPIKVPEGGHALPC